MPKQTFLNLPEEKHKMILACAIDEFAEYGYDGASISRMVAKAGIAKGSFYQYFENKDDLYAYVIDHVLVSQKMRISDEESPKLEGITLPEFMRLLLKRMMREFGGKPKLYKIGIDFLRRQHEPVGKKIIESYRPMTENYFQSFIRAEKSRNEIDINVDDDMLSYMIMGASTEISNLEIAKGYSALSDDYIDKWVDRLEYILTNGIYKDTKHSEKR